MVKSSLQFVAFVVIPAQAGIHRAGVPVVVTKMVPLPRTAAFATNVERDDRGTVNWKMKGAKIFVISSSLGCFTRLKRL